MRPASDGRSWPHYLVGIVLETVIFVVVGPFVGTVVFMIVWGILSGAAGGPIASMLVLVAYYPLFVLGYVMAWKTAAVTGVIVSAATPLLGNRERIGLFAAAVGAVVSLVALPLEMGGGSGFRLTAALAVAGAVAALACTWSGARLWQFGRRAGAAPG